MHRKILALLAPLTVCLLIGLPSAEANIAGSAIFQNQSGVANLDVPPAGLNLIDWAVWDVNPVHSNELNGGRSNFGPITIFNPTAEPTFGLTNRNSWTMNFSNAANGAPPSGNTFGWGPEWANAAPSIVGLGIAVKPNVAIGGRGVVRIYGHHFLGANFGGQFSNNTMTVDGGGNAGTQMWSLVAPSTSETWIYEMQFDQYNGETFNFLMTSNMIGTQPIFDWAGVMVAGIPEPGHLGLLGIMGSLAFLRRRRHGV